MANDYLTVADFAASALEVEQTDINDLKDDAPLVSQMMISDTSTGTNTHKYKKRTGAPVVGFRDENDGREYDHSEDTMITVTCKILDFSWDIDVATANAHPRGREYAIAEEGAAHLMAAMFKLEKQIFYGTGTGGDSAGFSGFMNSTFLDAVADEMVINAGGSTANTQTSAYGIRLGRNDVKLVTPMSQPIELGETTVIQKAGATGFYPAYFTPASLFIALQMGGKYSVGRIANLHPSDSGASLTDDWTANLRKVFPAGRKAQILAMNGDALYQLQQSRTATNPTGAPAPFPEVTHGMQIVETDALLSTEAVET